MFQSEKSEFSREIQIAETFAEYDGVATKKKEVAMNIVADDNSPVERRTSETAYLRNYLGRRFFRFSRTNFGFIRFFTKNIGVEMVTNSNRTKNSYVDMTVASSTRRSILVINDATRFKHVLTHARARAYTYIQSFII